MERTLGRYQILAELGRGAMGAVYRAVDPLIQREVAIKTLLPDLPEDVMGEVRERFLREARSAGRLSHPHIVTIFDVGEQDGIAYIAMEMLAGRSLQQMLRDPERLPFDRTAWIAAEVAEALDHAHQHDVVHRDVKPANVMVGPSGRCKLTDFGVAYVSASTLTQVGTALGSPRYMSPEHVLGVRVDARSDVFSLGSMLYEMLVRRTPFDRPGDANVFVVLDRIADEPHVPVREIDPAVPEGFEWILRRALAKKPEDRYQRAQEMAEELRNFRADAHEDVFAKTAVLSLQPAVHVGSPDHPLVDLAEIERGLEREQQARRREAEDERRKASERLRPQEQEMRRLREEHEHAVAQATGAEASRGRALELLRQRAARAPRRDEPVAQRAAEKERAAAIAKLNEDMRAAAHYLAEIAREINSIEPDAGCAHDHLFVGRLPSVSLTDAWSDSRSRVVGGKECCEHVMFRYRIRPDARFDIVLHKEHIARCEQYLKEARVAFEKRVETKNDFGEATRALFSLRSGLPCELVMKADYDALVVDLELNNVRRPGLRRARVAAGEFNALPDEFGRYLLGTDVDLEKRVAANRR